MTATPAPTAPELADAFCDCCADNECECQATEITVEGTCTCCTRGGCECDGHAVGDTADEPAPAVPDAGDLFQLVEKLAALTGAIRNEGPAADTDDAADRAAQTIAQAIALLTPLADPELVAYLDEL